MQSLQRIGILAHPLRPNTAPLAQQLARSLQAHGIAVWVLTDWDAVQARPFVQDSDLVIAIGGDGAMLRAARVSAPVNVPVLGINAGHLGFLTEVSPGDWEDSLALLLEGDYWIEQRMMISCVIRRGEHVLAQGDALNDVVISRGAIARSVQLETYIDGGWATTYHGDGLIIATPTGSTAYALAAGGPILPPELKNILMVPLAPHLSMDRPMVLSQGATIDVVVDPQTAAEVMVTIDGELVASLESSDQVTVRASESVSRFVRLRDRNYFYRSLLDRLEPRIPPRPGRLSPVTQSPASVQNQE
ncbi:MAG: NAD(+)/NADH kinase [Chloroflexi bacterium]|nr:NAD(+)/NADH kinase [Chloroflexota bacterium]